MTKYLNTRLNLAVAQRVMRLRPATVGEAINLAGDEQLQQSRQNDLEFAQGFIQASLFDRLAMVQSLKHRPRALVLVTLMAKLQSELLGNLTSFVALEQAQARLGANVGPRTVMEALALAL